MAKYRKKPVVIEAFKYGIDNRPDWFMDKVTEDVIITYPDHCLIWTLEGRMRGDRGDYIIQGVQGEIYPCKPSIFHETYEIVNESLPFPWQKPINGDGLDEAVDKIKELLR